jgi:CDP-paratose 2-epimerase
VKIFITGGCGFLGSNLAADALKHDDRVIIFDNLSRYGAIQNLNSLKSLGNIEFIHGDIRNHNDVNNAIKNVLPDAIFHAAGQVAMTTSIKNPYFDFETNTLGTINLLESVRQLVPNATVVYSSTNKVYGDLEQFTYSESNKRYSCVEYPNGFNEQVGLDFRSPYGCSKGAADQYMLDYAKIYGLKTVVFRHSSMYGNGQYASSDQGWVGWFCKEGIKKKNKIHNLIFHISGNGKQVRDILHASDMKNLYRETLLNIEKISGKAFNIGGGIKNSLSLLELFDLLETILNIRVEYEMAPARESDQRVFVADIDKINSLIKWRPKISPEDGIAETIRWLETQPEI